MAEILITPIYAAIIVLIMVVLATATSMQRGNLDIALGHRDSVAMHLAMRRFSNLAEYAAAALFILLMLEISGVSATWLHTYGISLVVLRLIHPFILFESTSAPTWKKAARFVTAAGTTLLMAAGAMALLIS